MPPLPNDRKPPSKPPKKRPLNVEDGAVDGDSTKIWIAACKKLGMSLNDYLWHPRFNDVLPVEVTVVLPDEAPKENGDPHNDEENGDPHSDEEEKRLDKLAEERRLDELAEEKRLEKLAEERRRDKLAEEEEMFQGFFDDLVNQGTLSRDQGTSAANAEGHLSSIHIPVDNPISVDMSGQSVEKPILSDGLSSWFFSSADAHGMQAAISIDAGASGTTADMPGQPIEKADPNFAMDDEIKQRSSDNIGTSSGADPEERSDNVDVSLGFSDPRVDRIYRYVRDVGLCYLRRLRSLLTVDIELELTRYELKANEVWGGFLQNSLQVQELFRGHDLVEFQRDLERTCQWTCTLIRRFRNRWDSCVMRYRVLEDVEDCLKHGRCDLSELIRGKHNAKNMVTDLKSAAMALMDCLRVIWDLYDLLKVIEMRRRLVSQANRKSVIRRGCRG